MSTIKKILFIIPPAVTFKDSRDINPLPPMGAGYLAAVGEKAGMDVRILDCLIRGWDHEEDVSDELVRVGLSDEDIKKHIVDFGPDMVGVSCGFSRQHKIYRHILNLIKKVKPGCITVAGGPHVTVCPENVLDNPDCDFIIMGEGEESFRDLLTAVNNRGELSSIDGLGWKDGGKPRVNAKKRWIEDLDSIPFPAYHVMELKRYFSLDVSHGIRHKNRFAPIVTSRGCPAKCTFCSAEKVWGRRYRMRSVPNVLEEMKILREKYGIEELMFEDDNVTADPKRAKELFAAMAEEKLNFIWDTPNGVGVWSMDDEMLDLMKASGCIRVNFPVESGSQRVLGQIIRKPLDLSKVRGLISHCRKIKLDYGMFLVIGTPGETLDEMWETFLFASSCGVYDPHISVATPYPGTRLLDICRENACLEKEFDLEDLFIRSFMIKTSQWGRSDLERVLMKGRLYLKYQEALRYPMDFLGWLIKKITEPKKMVSNVKKIIQVC